MANIPPMPPMRRRTGAGRGRVPRLRRLQPCRRSTRSTAANGAAVAPGSPTEAGDAETMASPAQAHVPPEAGKTFGSYHLVRLLGQGGMGAVYEAEQMDSGRRVALKILSQSLDSAEARARFLREGRLAASINHPNSVYIYGTEEIEGTPAIAMELVPGGTLEDRIKQKGPMPAPEAVDAILQIIEGLEAAQAVGVLHRDVKPSNCFIENDVLRQKP